MNQKRKLIMMQKDIFYGLVITAFFCFFTHTLYAKTGTGAATPSAKTRTGTIKPSASKNAVKLKIKTRIELKGMMGAVGDTVPVKAFLFDISNTPLVRKTLEFYVNNQRVGTAHTKKSGEAAVQYKVPNQTGPLPIKVLFKDTKDYFGSSGSAKFAAIKSSTKIEPHNTPNPSSVYTAGRTINEYCKLYRITDRRRIDGREIKVLDGNKVIDTTTTQYDGDISYLYRIPSNFAGIKHITYRFEGDGLYLPTAWTGLYKIKAAPKDAYLIWGSAKGMVGQNLTVKAYLSRAFPYLPSNGIGGKKITLIRERGKNWGGKQVGKSVIASGFTNSKGVANITFKVEEEAMGYNLYANLKDPGNEYNAKKMSKNQTLRVSKSPVQLFVSAGVQQAAISDTIMVSVIAHRTSDDQAVGNLPVRIAGYKKKATSHMGAAVFFFKIPYSMGTGNRTIKAWSDETERYLKGSGSTAIKILPKTN